MAYLVDGLWTVIAIVGVGVSIWAVVDSVLDRRARVAAGSNGMAQLIIQMNLRSAHASLYLHALFLVLGVYAFTHPSAAEASPTYILLVGGYIFVAATNVRAVGLNQLARLHLRRQ